MNNETNSSSEFSVKPKVIKRVENGVETDEELCFNTFFNETCSKSGNFLTSSSSSSTSSSPLSPLSPLVSKSNSQSISMMARNKLINSGVYNATSFESPRPTRAKRQVPSHLALYNNSTSSALQSISELPQSQSTSTDATITSNKMSHSACPRLIPINLLVDTDSSDQVFNTTYSTNLIVTNEPPPVIMNNESTNTSNITNSKNHDEIISQLLFEEKNIPKNAELTVNEMSELPKSESPNSLKLKRSQGFTDLPNMDELSSVTFPGSILSASSSKCDSPCHEDSHIQLDASDDSNHVSYVEEKKFVIKGIKVRAAKISKLVQILLDSFGKCFLIFLKKMIKFVCLLNY